MENQQGQQSAQSRRRDAGKNRQRMDETFVENSQHQVNHQHGHQQKQIQILQRRLKNLGRALESRGDRGRQRLLREGRNLLRGLAERNARPGVE